MGEPTMTFEIYNAFWKDESGATAIEAMYMAVAGVLSSVVGAP